MIVFLALTAQALAIVEEPAAAPPPTDTAVTATPAPMPPQDWTMLPTLRLAKPVVDSPALAQFVRGEVASGRCSAQRPIGTGYSLKIEIAVLVTPQGLVRRTVPRAIGCPSVEQYSAGLAFSRVMGNVLTDGLKSDSWYRTSMAFAWPG
ncbi:MAG: hypothetical protein OSB00_12650 [Sphingomonas bacterium]|nr:hypothetical protein [Sphingomonas bacterium]